MNNTHPQISSWILQYWYQVRNAVPMLTNIGSPIRSEDGPVFLFSTSFSSKTIDTDFSSRFSLVPWMTYRKDFEPIDGYTTDCGWGCMLRSAQMMLSEALFRRECLGQGSSVASKQTRQKVLRLFSDFPSSPYSIHAMSAKARKYGKRAGEWFEPTLTLLIVCEILEDRMEHENLRAIVARDGVLDASSIMEDNDEENQSITESTVVEDPLLHPQKQIKKSILLLIPLRLGLREINDEIYGEALIQALRFPQSVGMIGGKPGHSLYFCGGSHQKKKLIFLDPHFVQSVDSNLTSYQCLDARAMPIQEIDPSLALGFLISSYMDFIDFQGRVEALPGPAMFSITTKPIEHPSRLGFDEEEEEEFEEEEEEDFEQVVATKPKSVLTREEEEEEADNSFTAVTKEEVKSPGTRKKKEDFVFL